MADFDLTAMARRQTNRRGALVTLRPIFPTKAQAESLALIYVKAVRLIEQRRDRLVSIYAKTLGQSLQHDSINDIDVDINEMDAALRRLVLELTPSLRRWAFSEERWHRGKWQRNVLDAVSVTLETMLGPEDVREQIEAFVARNVALVRNVSDEARGRIADSVFRGFQRRAPAVEVAKEIREATGMARKRAIRIAGDQTVKLASALDGERIRQAGLDEWKWRHSGKVHFRPEHKERDGNVYSDETAPDDLPGQLPYCGCVRQAVLRL
jgi:SPP1 gp7 family putative phage head morphogenesis protein